jgi:hypothetical protein
MDLDALESKTKDLENLETKGSSQESKIRCGAFVEKFFVTKIDMLISHWHAKSFG